MARAAKKSSRKKAAAPARKKAAAKPAPKARKAAAPPPPRKTKRTKPEAHTVLVPTIMLVGQPLNDGEPGLRHKIPFAQMPTFGTLFASERSIDIVLGKKLYRTNQENLLLDLDEFTLEIGIDYIQDLASE